jgi:hypothetical protein
MPEVWSGNHHSIWWMVNTKLQVETTNTVCPNLGYPKTHWWILVNVGSWLVWRVGIVLCQIWFFSAYVFTFFNVFNMFVNVFDGFQNMN